VRSLEKKTFGSTFTGACLGLTIDPNGFPADDSYNDVLLACFDPNKNEKKLFWLAEPCVDTVLARCDNPAFESQDRSLLYS